MSVMNVPDKITQRFREPTPDEASTSVIAGSLPVISFGDAFSCRVATIAHNPSWREFHKQVSVRATGKSHRVWREGTQRRLSSLHSLGRSHASELTDDDVALAYADCVGYFHRKPYMGWFAHINRYLVDALNANYLDGSACHLDLVQWATAEVQGDIVKNRSGIWPTLVERDIEFLAWQMRNTSADIFVVNSIGVLNDLISVGLMPVLDSEEVTLTSASGRKDTLRVYSGTSDGKLFLAWNKPAVRGISHEGRDWLVEHLAAAARPWITSPG